MRRLRFVQLQLDRVFGPGAPLPEDVGTVIQTRMYDNGYGQGYCDLLYITKEGPPWYVAPGADAPVVVP